MRSTAQDFGPDSDSPIEAQHALLLVSRSELLQRDFEEAAHPQTQATAPRPGATLLFSRSVEKAIELYERAHPATVVLDVDDLGLLACECLSALHVLSDAFRIACISNRLQGFVPLGATIGLFDRQHATAVRLGSSALPPARTLTSGDYLDLCRLAGSCATLRLSFGEAMANASAEFQVFDGRIVNGFFSGRSGYPALAAALLRHPQSAIARTIRTCPVGRNIEETSFESTLRKEEKTVAKVNLEKLGEIEGFAGACLVDSESGMVLGVFGSDIGKLELAGSVNAEVVKAKREALAALHLKDHIEDFLITLTGQYHLIRPAKTNEKLFFYVKLDRKKANLALARHELMTFDSHFSL